MRQISTIRGFRHLIAFSQPIFIACNTQVRTSPIRQALLGACKPEMWDATRLAASQGAEWIRLRRACALIRVGRA